MDSKESPEWMCENGDGLICCPSRDMRVTLERWRARWSIGRRLCEVDTADSWTPATAFRVGVVSDDF